MVASTGLASLGVAALSLLATTVSAQQSTRITGAPDGQVHPRLEIREMAASNPDQFNLFLLATQEFQATSHDDIMGWYQMAGIHGMPYIPWNGVNGTNPGSGYCPHSMAIFVCWHRAYTLAWEQQTLVNAQRVVSRFTGADQQRYQNALSTMRLPYWDWAEIPPSGNPNDCLPDTMSTPQIQVNTPTGSQSIPNPLYAFYNMNPHPDSDFSGVGGGDWSAWGSTLRYPTSQDAGATSNEGSAISNLGINNPTARAQVYRVLTACPNFLDVSNDGVAEQNADCGVSLEAIHNGIHTFVGGPTNAGHMTYNNFAGFDPLFYLHHANVDRLFAMWQAVNPGSWMPSTTAGGNTFTINQGQRIDSRTPLEPFADGSGNYYTCDSLRDITQLRYTYPEIQQGNVGNAVNTLYGTGAIAQPLSTSTPSSSSSSTRSASSSSSGSVSVSGSGSGSISASGSGSASGSNSASASATPTTITTTNAQGSTITTVSTPVAPGGGSGGPTGAPTTVTTTNAQGSTITTVIPGGPTGGPTGGSGTSTPGGGKPGSIVSGTYVPGGTNAPGGSASLGTSPPFPTGGLGNSSSNSSSYLPGLLTPEGRTHDYTCHVVAEKHGLGGTFTIFGFLGTDIPSSPDSWLSHPDFCGAHSVFAPINADASSVMLVAGQIPLTTCLVQKIAAGALKSLDESAVLPFLSQNLNWKVATAQGKVVDNAQVPGLTVGAVSQKVMPAANPGSLPTYGQGNLANNVTSGKAGGIQNGMQYNWWDNCGASSAPHREL